MFNTEPYFAVILLVSLAWISGSHGSFTRKQVQNASEMIVNNRFLFDKTNFVPIAIRSRPDLNGFAMSFMAIISELALENVPVSEMENLNYVVQIEGQQNGGTEFYELHHDETEYIAVVGYKGPEKTNPLKLKVSNGTESIDVVAFPVEDKYFVGKKEVFVVIFERSQLKSFTWTDKTEITAIVGGSNVKGGADYLVFCVHPQGSQPSEKGTVPLDVATLMLLTQKSTTKLNVTKSEDVRITHNYLRSLSE